jgi:hypothetical protein
MNNLHYAFHTVGYVSLVAWLLLVFYALGRGLYVWNRIRKCPDRTPHKYGDWEDGVPDGIRTRTCSKCQHVDEEDTYESFPW